MAYDNSATSTSNPVAFTTSGGHRILTVGVFLRGTSPVCTGVTYNGVAMTLGAGQRDAANSFEMWYLIGPASGSNNIAFTTSGVVAFSSIAALSMNGMNQTAFEASVQSTGNAVTTLATSIATVSANASIVDAIGALGVVASISAQSGAVIKASTFSGNAPIGVSLVDVASAHTVTTGWDRNDGNTNYMAHAALAFAPLAITATSLTVPFSLKTANLTAARKLLATTLTFSFSGFSNTLLKKLTLHNPATHTGTLANAARHTGTLTNGAVHTGSIVNQATH